MSTRRCHSPLADSVCLTVLIGNRDYIPLVNLVGIYYQIRDDYMNIHDADVCTLTLFPLPTSSSGFFLPTMSNDHILCCSTRWRKDSQKIFPKENSPFPSSTAYSTIHLTENCWVSTIPVPSYILLPHGSKASCRDAQLPLLSKSMRSHTWKMPRTLWLIPEMSCISLKSRYEKRFNSSVAIGTWKLLWTRFMLKFEP